MDYDATRRYPHNASLGFPHYYFTERNLPLAMSHMSRTDPRNCPVGGPVGGPRGRGNMSRDDGAMESAQSRRRIAVACARCRKRKIRCSGDPGNGSGCQNCKQAGVDMNNCQFHRVGSDDAAQIISNRNLASSLASIANPYPTMPTYNAASGTYYPRPVSTNQYPQLDTKTVYPQSWTIPYSEDTSPVEAYNLDQPATYITSQNTSANVYSDGYRWNQINRKILQNGNNAYLEHELPISTSYPTHGLPNIQTNLRAAAGTEAQSPLNMTSLHSALAVSLPQQPHPREMQIPEATVPQRQLPIPQPSPAQTTRNVVDQLQDQRLRSAQVMGGSSLNTTGSYAKALLTWNSEPTASEIQGAVTTNVTSAELLATTSSPAARASTVTDGVMVYLPATTSGDNAATEIPPAPSQQQQQIQFSTSQLFETMPAPSLVSGYSNFRNSALPTSSSTEQLPLLARQNSHSNLYSYSSDSLSKRRAAEEASLVSGQRYTPLSQSQNQQATSLESLRHDSFENGNVPLHRASMSNLSRTY